MQWLIWKINAVLICHFSGLHKPLLIFHICTFHGMFLSINSLNAIHNLPLVKCNNSNGGYRTELWLWKHWISLIHICRFHYNKTLQSLKINQKLAVNGRWPSDKDIKYHISPIVAPPPVVAPPHFWDFEICYVINLFSDFQFLH